MVFPIWLQALQHFDRRRRGVPGEHSFAFTSGAWLLLRAGRGRSPLLRALCVAAGGALIYRSFSGRDGLFAKLRPESASASEQPVPPPDGGAAPLWPDEPAAEGRAAIAGLQRDRDVLPG